MKHFRHIAILVALSALSATAYPQLVQSYGLPQPGGGGGVPLGNPIGSSSSVLGTSSGRPCNGDEVRNVLGECVLPEISRNIFVYAAPQVIPSSRPRPNLPKPEVHYNFVFVKTADLAQQNEPIIIPPPQHKTLVYVLSKKQQQGGDSVIQTPYSPAPRPEVFYVNYGEGDNPQLPGGVDLQTALSSGTSQGQNLNFQNPNFGNSQNQGNNQNQGNSQNQGNNYVGNIIDGGIISGGIVSPAVNSPAINGGFINGGIVDGGIIDPGFGSYVQGGQGQIDSGFGQGGQGQIGSGFGQGGQGQIGSGFGQGGQGQINSGFGQSSNIILQSPTISQGTTGIQTPSSNLGYPSQTPSTPFTISPIPITPRPLPPSTPGQLYENPN